MKYTGRIFFTTPMIVIGSFWLILLSFFPQITVQPVHHFLFALLISPIFWFAGKQYDKSNHLNQKLKEQSDELDKNKKVLQEIFDNVDAMLWIGDLKTRELLVSKGIAKIYGYEPNEFSENSQLWFQGIHPEDKYFMAKFYEDLVSGNNRKAEHRIIKTNGDVSWVEARATPIFDQDGKVVKQTGGNYRYK
jgi:PAS domain S-box-containing protein